MWLGSYFMASGCDQTQCCCAKTSTIATAGYGSGFYTVTGTNLVGQCGSITSTSINIPVLTSDIGVNYLVDGQSHTASRQSNGNIYDQNNVKGRCSAELVKDSPAPNQVSGAGSSSSSSLNLLPVTLLIAAVIANN